MTVRIERFAAGLAVQADSTSQEARDLVRTELAGADLPLIIADPPYGNVVSDNWDKVTVSDREFAMWMIGWTRAWAEVLAKNAAFYVWGGAGSPGFRPFFRYLADVETPDFQLATPIVWGKKRAYGVQNNYLWTREELAYFVNGDAKKPRCFHIPLLETKRGYAGYNALYPAKSEYLRRTNVWTDISELFKGKIHKAQKPPRLHEVMIETHTLPGEWVVDLFAGSGVTALAAHKLGRRWICFESGAKEFDVMVDHIRKATE